MLSLLFSSFLCLCCTECSFIWGHRLSEAFRWVLRVYLMQLLLRLYWITVKKKLKRHSGTKPPPRPNGPLRKPHLNLMIVNILSGSAPNCKLQSEKSIKKVWSHDVKESDKRAHVHSWVLIIILYSFISFNVQTGHEKQVWTLKIKKMLRTTTLGHELNLSRMF